MNVKPMDELTEEQKKNRLELFAFLGERLKEDEDEANHQQPIRQNPTVIGAVGMILIGCYLVIGVLAFIRGLIGIRAWAWSFLIMLPVTALAYWLMNQTPTEL